NVKPAGRLRVHLVPADSALAEDLLRYYETPMRNDGTFIFKQLAPGKYYLLSRPVAEDESYERPARPLAWEQAERVKLRGEAEVLKHEVELQPCQAQKDIVLRYKGK